MKRLPLILFAICFVLAGCGFKAGKYHEEFKSSALRDKEAPRAAKYKEPEGAVDMVTLEERFHVYYESNTDELFSGKAYGLYPSGKKQSEGNIKDGKKNGKKRCEKSLENLFMEIGKY